MMNVFRVRAVLAAGAAPLALMALPATAQTLRLPPRGVVVPNTAEIALGDVAERGGRIVVPVTNRGTATSERANLRVTDARGEVRNVAVPAISAGQTVEVDAGATQPGVLQFFLEAQGSTRVAQANASASYIASAPAPARQTMRTLAPRIAPATTAAPERTQVPGAAPVPARAPVPTATETQRADVADALARRAQRAQEARQAQQPAPRDPAPASAAGPLRSAVTGRPSAPAVTIAQPQTSPEAPGKIASGAMAKSLNDIAQRITPLDKIVPPPGVAPAPAKAELLGSGEALATIQSHNVLKSFNLAQTPVTKLTFDNGSYDLTAFKESPGSLFPLRTVMLQNKDLFSVNSFDSGLYLTEKGLELRSFLNYSLNIGVCADNARSSRVRQAKIECAERLDPAKLAKEMADPASARYVPNPALRAKKVAQTMAAGTKQLEAMKPALAKLRGELATPEMQAKLGPDQANRLLAITDDAKLAGEIISASETKLETVLTLPVAFSKPGNIAKVDASKIGAGVQLKGVQLDIQDESAPPAPEPVKVDAPASYALSDEVFLTGFTLGKKYEWRYRVEQTIPLCLVGCEETYFAEAYAGFEYGVGLRFPVKVGGTFDYEPGSPTATLTPFVTTIDGTPADYKAAGLEQGKIFDGQELVARVGAWAGVNTHLPLYPDISFEIGPRLDFTQYLPSPLTGGNFLPPTPDAPLVGKPYPITQIDLLNNMANFGIIGAHVHPAVQVSLQSSNLSLTGTDLVSKKTFPVSDKVPVQVTLNDENKSEFKLGNPSYTVSMLLTPGIDARLFVDVGLWSHNWDFIVMFPALSIEIPSGGVTFGPHDGATKERLYEYGPDGGTQGAVDPDPIGEIIDTAVKKDVTLPAGPCDAKCTIAFEDKKNFGYRYREIRKGLKIEPFGLSDPVPGTKLSDIPPARFLKDDAAKYRAKILYEYNRSNNGRLISNLPAPATRDDVFLWFLEAQKPYRTGLGPALSARTGWRKAELAKIDAAIDTWAEGVKKACLDRYCPGDVEKSAQRFRSEAAGKMALQTTSDVAEAKILPDLTIMLNGQKALLLEASQRRKEFAALAIETVDNAADQCPDAICRADMTTALGRYEDYSHEGLKNGDVGYYDSWADLKPKLQADLAKILASANQRKKMNAAEKPQGGGWNLQTTAPVAGAFKPKP